jgi:hypothetical protein
MSGRMRIRIDLQPRILRAQIDGPDARVAQKETLLGREAIERFGGVTLELLLVGQVA